MTSRTWSEAKRWDQSQRRFREGVRDRERWINDAKPARHDAPAVTIGSSGLRLFVGDVDWVVAFTIDDALDLLGEHYCGPGKSYEDATGHTQAEARGMFDAMDLDAPLTIFTDIGDWLTYRLPRRTDIVATPHWPVVRRDRHQVYETAPAWWWVQISGRGFLATSEI